MQIGEIGRRPVAALPVQPIGRLDNLRPDRLPIWDGDRLRLASSLEQNFPRLELWRSQIVRNELSDVELKINLLRPAQSMPFSEVRASAGGAPILTPFAIPYAAPEIAFDAIKSQIRSLPNNYYELWPSDHNVNSGSHFPDPWGDATAMLSHLEFFVPTVRPPVNHNKISARRQDMNGLNELHVDGFEGMPADAHNLRMPVFRHFYNMGTSWRTTAIALHAPAMVDKFVPNAYTHGYLDKMFDAMGCQLDVAILNIPPRDPSNGLMYGLKILTSHLVHGEYGKKDDMLAIVNSLR